MAKGRNTTLLTTRIPDPMFEAIKSLAAMQGKPLSEYVGSALEAEEELQQEMVGRRQMDYTEETAR